MMGERMIIPCPEEAVLSKVDLVATFSEIEGDHGPDCHSWTSELRSRMRAAEEAGDEQARQLWHLLFVVCDPFLTAQEGEPAYGPWHTTVTSRSFIPSDLEPIHLDFLSKILVGGMPPDFCARVLDFRWLRLRNHEAARKAVPFLLHTAETMFALTGPKVVPGAARLTRAGQIVLELGRDQEALKKVANFLASKLKDAEVTSHPFLLNVIFENYIALDIGNHEELAAKALKAAEKATTPLELDWAAHLCGHAASLYKKIGETELAKDAHVQMAETHVKAADYLTQQGQSSLLVVDRYRRAIAEYRRVGGQRRVIDTLQSRMQRHQSRILAEMKPIETPMDITRVLEEAQRFYDRLAQCSLCEKLLTIGLSYPLIPDMDKLRKSSEEVQAMDLFRAEYINDEGHTVAYEGGVGGTADAEEARLRDKMIRDWQLEAQLKGATSLDTLRLRLRTELVGRESELMTFFVGNPFVVPGHELIYARGIRACINGDALVGITLLTLQLESSIRAVLEQHGVQVVNMNTNLTQEFVPLHSLLRNPSAQEVFGEARLFVLQALLVDKRGFNLRNRVAHGLIPSLNHTMGIANYLLWIVIHLCSYGVLRSANAPELNGDEDTPEASD
jgi:hypothetical protein